jgi:hypothetical protein
VVATAAVATAGVLAVTGCTFHPGRAAVVNGSSISQSRVDNLVLAACAFSKQQRVTSTDTGPSTSVAYLRSLLTGDLISFQIIAKAYQQMGLQPITPAQVAQITKSEPVPASLSSSDRSQLTTFFAASARSELQEAVIGAHLTDPSVTSAAHVTSDDIKKSTAYLKHFTAQQQVALNPSYGTWADGTIHDTDGSLSAAVSGPAKTWLVLRAKDSSSVAGLPANQVCG